MGNIYRGPSIDAFYQVSVHSAEGFQRRRLKCEKLTDDKRRTTDAKWWQKLTLPLARWAKNEQNFFLHFVIGRFIFLVGERRRGWEKVEEGWEKGEDLPLIHVLMFVVYVLVIIEYDHGISLILPSYVIWTPYDTCVIWSCSTV